MADPKEILTEKQAKIEEIKIIVKEKTGQLRKTIVGVRKKFSLKKISFKRKKELPDNKAPLPPSPPPEEKKPQSGANPASAYTLEAYPELNEKDYDFDIYGNKKKKETTPTSAGGGIKAPKHPEAPKSGGGGNTIMDVFWNDLIVPAYTKCISGAVNLSMSFMDYVLFDAYIPQSAQKPKEEKERKDIWGICLKVYEKYENNVQKGMKIFGKAHKELMENIDLAKAGLAPTWNIWPNKKEPTFFNDLVEISKKADANPNSPEAETWKRITSMPELMKKLFKMEIVLRKLSISMAGMEVALAADNYVLPKDITKLIKDMDDLGSLDNEDTYKEKMKTKISEFKEKIKDESTVNKELAKILEEIEKDIDDPHKKHKDRVASISEKIKQMKDTKPLVQEAEIDEKSQKYYNDMRQNIEKINEIYAADPKKAAETIDQYLASMKDKTTPALSAVDKYLKTTRLGRAIHAVGKKIRIKKKKSPDDSSRDGSSPDGSSSVDDATVISEMKRKATESFQKSTASISGFSVEGQNIGSRANATNGLKSPFTEPHGIFKIYNDNTGR